MSTEPVVGATGGPDRNSEVDERLGAAVRRVARTPQLLLVCDYDGTLAPIVEDPVRAAPLPEAVAAVRSLAALPQTTVAVISGRALRDLAALSRLPSEVYLVGSHGSEFDVEFVGRIAPELSDLRTRLGRAIAELTRSRPGVRLEQKPAGVAVHTRGMDRRLAADLVESLRSGPATWPEVYVTMGKEVIELSVVVTSKARAIDELRTQQSASAVVFLGDDEGDDGAEGARSDGYRGDADDRRDGGDDNAFARLQGPDVGIRVGPGGGTRAGFTVADPAAAADVLALLTECRRRWLFGERAVPIERHTMIANGSTLALLTPSAKVCWLCHPRPDSPAVFGALLGDDSAGYFSVEPYPSGLDRRGRADEPMPLGQRYRSGTMTVVTRWAGLTVCDWLSGDDSETSLYRVLSGSVPVRLSFAPRPEFGQVISQLEATGDELRVIGSNAPIVLVAPGVRWDITSDAGHHTAHAVVDLARTGGSIVVRLRLGADGRPAGSPDEASTRDQTSTRDEAEGPWRDWAAGLHLPAVAREAVLRSALTLRALFHQPTGAMIAAATTSLPEEMGGLRNWDYRYCWLRDAAMSALSLVRLGSTAEAQALLAWTRQVIIGTGGHPERLHPLYTVDGYELGAEAVIETLPGYAGSRPVRVGNAANRQVQLDVFGPVADLVAHHADLCGALASWQVELVGDMVEAVARRWHEPDHGIWEARIAPRHHIYSKVMGWLTVDRALRLGERHGMPVRPSWAGLRDMIAEDVLTRGWHAQAGAYTVAYDHPEIDASSLWIGLSGLLADDDPRFLATVLAVESQLRSGPVVYRYRWDDGLPGREGGFHLCSAWLVEAYLRTGRRADAEELFGQMLACTGPTGLLPEQYDPMTERGLGNHPQAYSHLGLINCALLLDGQ